jgi:hypothetical protein
MGRLVTREDPAHVHKALGACALAHFAYRFGSLAVRGTMGLDGTPVDVALVACHATLSLSSLVFRLPARRHERMPMIYPEFRAHSVLFALRSVACCVLAMLGVGVWARAAVCVATMLAADAATARHAEGTTMRAMPFDAGVTAERRAVVTLYHSLSQANATALMVLDADAAFAPLLAIQLAAFLMTLVRKGFISTTTWHGAYTATLAACVFAVDGRGFAWSSAVGAWFAVARMWLGAPKYLVWAPVIAARLWGDAKALAPLDAALAPLDAHAAALRFAYLACVACIAVYGLWGGPVAGARAGPGVHSDDGTRQDTPAMEQSVDRLFPLKTTEKH